MCGIFGLICSHNEEYDAIFLKRTFIRLAKYSESRGKESCGFVLKDYYKNRITVYKGALPVTRALRDSNILSFFNKYFIDNYIPGRPVVVMGHSRLVTNGSQLSNSNNQPVIKDGIIGIHNGIIVNADEIWENHNSLKREYSIDTEVFLAVIRYYLNNGMKFRDAIHKTSGEVKGTITAALLFDDIKQIYLGTNNGSLYILFCRKGLLLFASEKSILLKILTDRVFKNKVKDITIEHVESNTGYLINPFDLSGCKIHLKEMNNQENEFNVQKNEKADITLHSISSEENNNVNSIVDLDRIIRNPAAVIEKSYLQNNFEKNAGLKRCTKCILPETFPFIEFDDKGECNYCRNYVKKNQPKPVSLLQDLVEPYRSRDGKPDCIIPFSGGRDSSFTLHYIKTELGLTPIAFTYDWGMVTDLARRNIARVCGKLGVENIIVSANIKWKRENIRKNIIAWLKYPQLGMIPLFMAGDKYFFYYTHKIKKQTGVKLNIWGINPLENTDFKVGFAGIQPQFNKKRIYSLKYLDQVKLLYFVINNYIKSPSYINQSIFDTFGSYLVRYFYPKKDYYHFYDYFRWDESLIEQTIIKGYDWELATDTKSTWRIGDGTAAFYNYVYYTIAGFSENDTFRSNQIREGMISREEALRKVEEENTPRYESIKWYLEIIGLDFETIIKQINTILKLYQRFL